MAAVRQRDRDPDALGAARRCLTRWRWRTMPGGSGAFRCSTAPATASSFAAAISTRMRRSRGCSANRGRHADAAQRAALQGRGAARGNGSTIASRWALSSGFMEPLESTSIHLIQRAVLRLIRMLPLREVSERDIARIQRPDAAPTMLQIRDFLILHYKATDRRDSRVLALLRGHGDPGQPDPEDRAVPRDRPGVSPQRGIVRRKQLGAGDDGAGDHAASPITRSRPSLAMRK